MHSCQDIDENRCFSNGGTNLHIHTIAQGRPGDNQVEFLQGPHRIVNPPKNLVLNNIRRFTMEHIGAANGLQGLSSNQNEVSINSKSDLWRTALLIFVLTLVQLAAPGYRRSKRLPLTSRRPTPTECN